MVSGPLTWEEVVELMRLLSAILGDDGRTVLPARGAEIAVALDAQCDRWRMALFDVLADPPLPEPALRPWLLARTLAAASLAQALARDEDTLPGPLTRTLLEQLLIHEWHGSLRDLWRRVPVE